MNPAKIIIEGNYWDCQIYRGRLYLFTIDGTLKIINWNSLIDSILVNEFVSIALHYAFKNGRELYSYQSTEFINDPDIRAILRAKFDALNALEMIVTEGQLNNHLIGMQDSPFKELHTDSEIFSNRLFVLTHNSLLSSTVHRNNRRYSVSSRAVKHFDLYAFALKANNYARIAVSAGDDGLMEYNASFNNENIVMRKDDERRMKIISERHSTFADYSFLSIYNSSIVSNSFLAYQKWNDDSVLVKEDDISENIIFGNSNRSAYLSWGYKEKIYRAIDGGFEIVRFNNYADENESKFSIPKFINLQPWKGRILSASTAYFGTILHCEYAIVVMLSDGTFYNIPGNDISRFRIYPRSLNYENHLHIVFDNRIEINSFNNDYFINQRDKDFGVAFKPPKSSKSFNAYEPLYIPDNIYYNLNSQINETENNINDEETPF